MIVETSALIAILAKEPERPIFLSALEGDANPKLSAANYLEAAIVADRSGDPRMSRNLDGLLTALDIEVVEFTPSQARLARQAYRDFGRGSGHPARLDFGDCFAYALAIETDEALLYKGDDFAQAGVRSALPT